MQRPPVSHGSVISVVRVFALVAALSAAGCDGKPPAKKAAAPQPVDIVTLKAQAVPITTTLPGRIVAYRVAQVRPQVSGIIRKLAFVEGGDVKQGQQLYQIDPAPYQASYDSAKANLMNAKAALTAARLKAERYKPLAQYKAVSKLELADADAAAQQAAANVAAAGAALETASINLRYTKVLSPISGRTGRSSVTEGALVTSDQTTPLTTVQQLDPIYVDVTQPSNVLLRLEHEYAKGKLKQVGPQQAQVRLILDDDNTYASPGKLQFSEVTVDQNTGAVTLRAVFPNPHHLLLPGMFVHMRIQEGVSQDALLVPQRGVTHDSDGKATVLLVDKDNKVQRRSFETRRTIGDDWLVSDGLKAGDRVIVSGIQHVDPGDTVDPQTAPADVQGADETDRPEAAAASPASAANQTH